MQTNVGWKMWFLIRTAVVVFSLFSASGLVSPDVVSTSNITWGIVPLIGTFVLLFVSVGFFMILRISKATCGPKWNANPFSSFANFIHLGAWACLATGVGAVVLWLTSASNIGPPSCSYLAFGLAAVVGIKIGTSFYMKHLR